jgi:hypothetical protein
MQVALSQVALSQVALTYSDLVRVWHDPAFSLPPPPSTRPACLAKSWTPPMMMKMSLRARLLHRKHPEKPKKTFPTTFNFQTELVLYQPSSKPLASVSIVSRMYSSWLTLPLDDNNDETLQMKVARLEKENTKLKRKRKNGWYFFDLYISR